MLDRPGPRLDAGRPDDPEPAETVAEAAPPAPAAGATLKHRPLIDGLRGFLITLMVGYHLGGWTAPAGGWIGLGTFFLLSGYLITSILLIEHGRSGRVDYVAFLSRRARRLAPALLTVLTGVVVVGAVLGDTAMTRLRDDALASLFYVANWRFVITDQSYFASFEVSPLRHMWSLAVEEQFYAVWPFAVVALLALVGRRRLWIVLAAGVAASALWMRILTPDAEDLSRAYYGTDARAQELLLGALLAVLVAKVPDTERVRRVGSAIGVAGLAAYGVLILTLHADHLWVYREGGFLLAALAGALVVYGCSRTDTGPLSWLFGSWPMQYLGARSYSLYLVHWPVIVFMDETRFDWSPVVLDTARIVVSLAITEVVHRAVEVPIHRRRWNLPRPGVTLLGAAATVAVVILVATALPADDALPEVTDGGAVVTAPPATGADGSTTPVAPGDRVVVLGDSMAWVLIGEQPDDVPFQVTGAYQARCDIIGARVHVGGTLNEEDPSCPTWPDRWAEALAGEEDAVVVILGLRQLYDLDVDGERVPVGSDRWATLYREAVERALGVIRAGTDAPIIWMDVPCYAWGAEATAGEESDPARLAAVNEALADALAADPATTVAPYAERVCTGAEGTEPDLDIRPDGAHLTPEATRDTWRWLEPMVRRAQAEAGAR